MKPSCVIVMFASCISLSAFATEPQPKPLSVYEIHPLKDGLIIGTSALADIIPYAFANQLITRRCPCDSAEVNSLDRSVIGNRNVFMDNLSDATVGIAAAAPIALDLWDVGASKEFVEDLVVYVETLSVNGAFVSLAKYTVQRPLPRTYAGTDPELAASPGGYRSFYSGHASMAFSSLAAASVTLNLRHHAGILPWLVTAGIGTSVALERVAAGRHFYTDVIVGAVAGTAVGIVVPWLHQRKHEIGLSLMPVNDGLGLAWQKRF